MAGRRSDRQPLGRPGSQATSAGPDQPPPDLGSAGRSLWAEMSRVCPLGDPAASDALAQACRSLDRAKRYRARIAVEGPIIRTPSGLRSNPLLFREISALAFCIHTLTHLGRQSGGKAADSGPTTKQRHVGHLVRDMPEEATTALPAIAEQAHALPIRPWEVLHSAAGEILHPEREPGVDLERLKAAMAGQVFAAQ